MSMSRHTTCTGITSCTSVKTPQAPGGISAGPRLLPSLQVVSDVGSQEHLLVPGCKHSLEQPWQDPCPIPGEGQGGGHGEAVMLLGYGCDEEVKSTGGCPVSL